MICARRSRKTDLKSLTALSYALSASDDDFVSVAGWLRAGDMRLRLPILAGTSGVTMLVMVSMALATGGVRKSPQASAAARVAASAPEVTALTTRAATPTSVAEILFIVRRAGGLGAGEAPLHPSKRT